jgi:hypothetical protein
MPSCEKCSDKVTCCHCEKCNKWLCRAHAEYHLAQEPTHSIVQY